MDKKREKGKEGTKNMEWTPIKKHNLPLFWQK
jgi:hypothetical protein